MNAKLKIHTKIIMDRRKHQNYSAEQIRKAIADVKKGISIRKVANLHKISRATLQRKLKDDGTHLATKRGPSTLFSADQENEIVMWIKTMANAGFPVSKKILIYFIEKLAKECEVIFPGGNTQPGRKWFEAFLRRHPDISLQTGQNLTRRGCGVTQENIDNWFVEVENYLKVNKLEEVLRNPQRVFNCEETAFFLNPKPGKVLAEKGLKTTYTASGGDEKSHLTVFLTANAAGELTPPMVVYRYATIPQQFTEVIMPTDWCIGKSENGWMTQETFYEYIINIFEPYLTKNSIERPVILFMDSSSSHLTLPITTFCKNQGIEIVALLANATHLIQPMDVSVFHTLKTIWRQEVGNFQVNHEGLQIQKCDFPQVLKATLQHVTPDTIISGFNACGLVPWNPKKVIVATEQKSDDIIAPGRERCREMISFSKILEEKIGRTKLIAFEANDGQWEGALEQSDLYKLWSETKQSLKPHRRFKHEEHSQLTPVSSMETQEDNDKTLENRLKSPVLDTDSFWKPLNIYEPVAGPSNVTNELDSLEED